MDVTNLMDEIGDALGQIDGLRVYAVYMESVYPPAAVVGWPDLISYDQTMGRGSDRITVPIYLVVGKADIRSAQKDLSLYLAGAGDKSVKEAVDTATYTAADAVRVTQSRIELMEFAGTDYLTGIFDVDCFGTGS